MKKAIFALGIILTFINCSSNEPKVDRIVEDGVEIIQNHMEPYKIKGESSYLRLEEELTIDLENKEFEDLGLAHPEHIDADSNGNLYLVDRSQSLEYFIYKFDKQGNFIDSVGRRGQGPGELPNLTFMGLNAQDEIWISCWGGRKIVLLDKNGTFLKEIRYPTRWQAVIPLENGNYLAMETVFDETKGSAFYHLILYNSGFKEITQIDFFDWSHNLPGKKRH